MNLGISAGKFEGLSKEKKKQYVAELLIRESKAAPVIPTKTPIAIVMAGLPGAGKTEFLDSLDELLKKRDLESFVRIDLDQIVTVYPKYTPQSYDKFRSQGNHTIARSIDVARVGRYNMMVDGTFSGLSGASINNIDKLLESDYMVLMIYMYDDALTAWRYTQAREIETRRGISRESFLKSCEYIPKNLKIALSLFKNNKAFGISAVVQKKLRDKSYNVLTTNEEVEAVIEKGYNIDEIKKIL